jgi:xylulokinase
MTTFLGIDLGTSAVKAVLVDAQQTILVEASRPLASAHPHPLWSEQDPEAWWQAVAGVLDGFHEDFPHHMAAVAAIGFSGQMHAPVCLDAAGTPMRPAILWNDGRAQAEAAELAAAYPGLADVVGVVPMAGFTAPKLLWLARHEPELFGRIDCVLLPKDYVRLRLTGERVTDMADASGTWWLDVAARRWSQAAVEASGLRLAQMPQLVEGNAATGPVRADLARRWGLSDKVVVAGGAGDVAAAAVGLGAIEDGDCFLSLGTSAQLFVTAASHRASPRTLVHAFAHALPRRWFRMAAMLNGASCLAFAAKILGGEPAALVHEAELAFERPSDVTFLPYLSGERTPHNDPNAKGVFFGLDPATERRDLVQAVLEGVAFSFADGLAAVESAGIAVVAPALVGGGAQSALWTRILASVLDRPLTRYRAADKGPAFGAARLARLAVTDEDPKAICVPPALLDVTLPQPALTEAYAPKLARFRRLYDALRAEFQSTALA